MDLIRTTPLFFVETPVFTFTLPDLSVYSDGFRTFLEKDLIEMSTLLSLESAGRLNWGFIIGAIQRLWPLSTTGDGNCLLHAASLGMWGFHDRLLTLRKALHEFLTRSRFSRPLWRRWRWQSAMQNKETDLVLSPEEWEAEWESVLQLASSAPRGGAQNQEIVTSSAPNLSQSSASLNQGKPNCDVSGPVYESLEEIHVLALAHVLRRPIIVVADTTLKDMNGDPLAPISFGGIYLPLECPPKECQRSPLILTYDAAHFSALVIMEASDKDDSLKLQLPAVIPVTDCNHNLLPIQFVVDPGEDFSWERNELDDQVIQRFNITDYERKDLLSAYLDLTQVPIPSSYLEAAGPHTRYEEDQSHLFVEPMSDLDKKPSDFSFDSDDSHALSDGAAPVYAKGKAPMQLQTMVRSFGSLGRSVSKRIKKNLSKFSRSNSFRKKNHMPVKGELGYPASKGARDFNVATHQSFILGAKIHTDKRHAYQQEMIENYLATARERFMKTPLSQRQNKHPIAVKPANSSLNLPSLSSVEISTDSTDGRLTQCINPGCELYGTAQTSYMCLTCFNRQKVQEEKEYHRKSGEEQRIQNELPDGQLHSLSYSSTGFTGPGLQYGTGKSRFYAALDEKSVKSANSIPVTQTLSSSKDKTLFLSNSTFYNDSVVSSIPSYNLNRDSIRDSNRTKQTSRNSSSESIVNRNSSSNSDKIQSNRCNQDRLSSTKDTLAPISIDNIAGANLGASNIRNKVTTVRPSSEVYNVGHSTTRANVGHSTIGSSKPCLTSGCEFYGSPFTDYYCSRCHLTSKNAAESHGTNSSNIVYGKDVNI